jgi:hypothetical protein
MRRVLAFGSIAAIAAALSCRDPTEVVVEVHTNVPYKSGIVTSFTVGSVGETESAFSTTETRDPWGPDGFVGSLVVVPGSSKDASLSVKIVMGVTRDPHDCSIEKPDGCIFSRRTLHYVAHRELHLPVAVYAQCIGVPCDASSTCNYLGQCVSAAASCEASDCPLPGDIVDGGVAIPPSADASPDVDASQDAALDGDAHGLDDAGGVGIHCPGGDPCAPGNVCCHNPSAGTYACIPSGGTCLGPTYRCDGKDDCNGGEFCCGNSGGSQCAAIACPITTLCTVDADCTAPQKCTSMTVFPQCQ